MNPYIVALSLISRTLESFDDDNLIPCYGFGDMSTRGDAVFSFLPNNTPAHGLQHVLQIYRQAVPHINLSGPTSFAPLIRQAIREVYKNNMEFTVLVIVADGQISPGCRSDTVSAIVDASSFPLPIIMIGVGDGPWDTMEEFDDALPARKWDNFQFVEFNKLFRNENLQTEERKEASFALHALMELPDQFKIAQNWMGMNAKPRVEQIIRSISPAILRDPPY